MRPAYIGSRAARRGNGSDPYFSDVVFLLNPAGAAGSTTFVDKSPSPKIITPFGDAKIDTSVTLFGAPTVLFDGSGDYLSVANSTDFDLGAGDFCFEMFVRPASNGAWWVMGRGDALTAAGSAWSFYNGGTWDFYGGTSGIPLARPTVTVNTWSYWTATRNGGTLATGKDGAVVGTGVISTTSINTVVRELLIGQYAGSGFVGNIGPIRITRRLRNVSSVPGAAFPTF